MVPPETLQFSSPMAMSSLAEYSALLIGAYEQAAVGDLMALGPELHEVHAHLRSR